MKSKEVLKILKITRPTLTHYIQSGKIKGSLQPNGQYNYDKSSVFKLLNKDLDRTDVIYCRVSTSNQKEDLKNQEDTISQFCNRNGIIIRDVYRDIGSGINFDRKEFQRLLIDIVNYKIDRVFITYKDRLSRISFNMFKTLFEHFSCEIVVLNEESYTSKCDSLVLEPLNKQESYLGKRVKRGLFQSSIKKVINADVNGSINILRKVISDDFIQNLTNRGLVFNPVKVNPLQSFICV